VTAHRIDRRLHECETHRLKRDPSQRRRVHVVRSSTPQSVWALSHATARSVCLLPEICLMARDKYFENFGVGNDSNKSKLVHEEFTTGSNLTNTC
jgi:hypothetical protein